MYKKRIGIIFFVIPLLLVLSVTAACEDLARNAKAIELNTNYSSHLERWDEVQHYSFTLPSSGVISISFSHEFVESKREYWALYLFDQEGNELLYQSYCGNTVEERISPHIGLPAGIFYIRIKPDMGHLDTGLFTFRINFEPSDVWEDELNEYKHTATAIRTNTEYNGTLRNSKDKDYYVFTLPAAGYVSFDFSHEFVDQNRELWFLRLEDAEEGQLFDGGYSGRDVSVKTSNRIGLPEGTYYICVYPLASREAQTVVYRFSVHYTEDESWEREFNDNIVSVNPISLNKDYHGSLISQKDKDCFSFTLPAPGCISVRFFHDYTDTSSDLWKVSILNDEGDEYYRAWYRGNTLKAHESDHIGLPEGTYCMEVRKGSQYSSADYEFCILYSESDAWEKEFNDTVHTANPIELETNRSGSLSSDSDVDCYRFEMPAEGYLDIEFQHAYVDRSDNLWKLQILTDENEEYDFFGFTGDTEEVQMPFTSVMPAGTYYIRISKYNGYSSADYHFLLKYHESSSAEPEDAPEATAEPEAAEWICPNCGYQNDTSFCIKCGTGKPEKIVCPGCGAVYEPDSGVVFCGACGTKVQ